MNPDAAIDRHVAREAARWLMHLASGQASAEDTAACDRWRARSAMHEQAWQRAQRLKALLGSLPPELARATLERPAVKTRRLALKTLAGLILGTPAAWAAWRGGEQSGLLADYRSAPGERRDLTLADGTLVTLNSGTAVDITADGLRLRAGEIYVRAGDHPCVAHTPQGQVGASQARFVLRLLDQGCRVEVYEGQVRLQPARGLPGAGLRRGRPDGLLAPCSRPGAPPPPCPRPGPPGSTPARCMPWPRPWTASRPGCAACSRRATCRWPNSPPRSPATGAASCVAIRPSPDCASRARSSSTIPKACCARCRRCCP
ncbi:sigma factor regulatory protein, FecR/PupR family [Bordetella hinzii CA90 BAL1384]|nr:FecR domain-containing protein [Bordetella hinzii]KCB31979.1 sigma factor regulatory protein, FecR/PupR family [Bordetella hinzii CA90 BAL1384]